MQAVHHLFCFMVRMYLPLTHTTTHTHTFYSSMTVIKHAPSQPSFIPYIHCQAAMALSPTMHFKYARCWRQIEFRVCLSFKCCSREHGASSGRGMCAAAV